MKRYKAIFDRYDFEGEKRKLVLKQINTGTKCIREGYIDAMDDPDIIGTLPLGCVIKFYCEGIFAEDYKVNKPTRIMY